MKWWIYFFVFTTYPRKSKKNKECFNKTVLKMESIFAFVNRTSLQWMPCLILRDSYSVTANCNVIMMGGTTTAGAACSFPSSFSMHLTLHCDESVLVHNDCTRWQGFLPHHQNFLLHVLLKSFNALVIPIPISNNIQRRDTQFRICESMVG